MKKRCLAGLAVWVMLGMAEVASGGIIASVSSVTTPDGTVLMAFDASGNIIPSGTLVSSLLVYSPQGNSYYFSLPYENFNDTGLSLSLWGYTQRAWGYEIRGDYYDSVWFYNYTHNPSPWTGYWNQVAMVFNVDPTVGDLLNESARWGKFFAQEAGTASDSEQGPNPVPEPATMLLFGTGIAGLAGSRFRRRK